MNVRRIVFRNGSGRSRALVGLAAGSVIAAGLAGVAVAPPASAALSDVVTVAIEGTKTSMTAVGYKADGSAEGTSQDLNISKNCNQGALVQGSLLDLSASGGTGFSVGIYGLSMGVTDSLTSNGAACSQVNTSPSGETLTLKVNTPAKGALFSMLDIEVQKNVVVSAQPLMNGGPVGDPFVLRSGTSAQTPGSAANTTLCNKGATSSGSNNSSTDNCKWVIFPEQRFNSLVLTASTEVPGGQFSIEGGSDWSGGSKLKGSGNLPANASYFYSGDGCTTNSSTITLTNPTTKVVSATYTPDSVNVDGTPCISTTGKTLTADTTSLTLTNPNASAFEQGTVRATWTATPGTPAKSSTDVNFVPTSNANYGNYWITMPWCPSSLFNGSTRRSLTGISSDPATAAGQLTALGLVDQDFATSANTPLPNNNRFQYACVVSRSTVYVPPTSGTNGTFQTTDTLYLIGDVVWRG